MNKKLDKNILDLHREAIKEKIKESYRIYQPKMVMYSFRIDREILEGAKKEAVKHSISAAAFIRQAIVEKIDGGDRINALENRLSKVEDKI